MAARKKRGKEKRADAGTVSQRPRGRDRRAPNAPPKLDRIRLIKRMMAHGEWVTGVTGHDLADEWDVSLSTVEQAAAEASRALKDAIDSEELGQRLVAILLTNIAEARRARRYEAVARSVEAAARIAGVEAPKKLDVGGSLAELLALGLAPGGEEPDPAVGD